MDRNIRNQGQLISLQQHHHHQQQQQQLLHQQQQQQQLQLQQGTTKQRPTMVNQQREQTLPPIAQHDELIKYIHEAWHKVTNEQEPVFYKGTTERISGFTPFDLDGYWGRRLVQNISLSRSSNQ